jgi:drug efflux transport system ATP-binding protein
MGWVIPMDDLIVAEQLTRHFGPVRAVDGLNLRVGPGEIFGLVGPDGAGKTTTMRLLCGAYEPTSGRAVVAGFDLRRQVAEARAATGYVPQKFSLYLDLTPAENLEFFAEAYGMSRAARVARAQELLDFVGLAAFAHRRAEFLSGGMKQKLSLACALIHRPRVLLLDEPTGGVDPVARQEFWRLLYTLLAEGSAILISTPYMDEASRCHRVGLMNHGQLMAKGTPHQIVRPLVGHLLELAAVPQRKAREVSSVFPGVADVQVFGDRLHLRVDQADPVMEGLPRALAEAGVQVAHLRPAEPILEDVFTQLLARDAVERVTR